MVAPPCATQQGGLGSAFCLLPAPLPEAPTLSLRLAGQSTRLQAELVTALLESERLDFVIRSEPRVLPRTAPAAWRKVCRARGEASSLAPDPGRHPAPGREPPWLPSPDPSQGCELEGSQSTGSFKGGRWGKELSGWAERAGVHSSHPCRRHGRPMRGAEGGAASGKRLFGDQALRGAAGTAGPLDSLEPA